jgi:hypothetical protein
MLMPEDEGVNGDRWNAEMSRLLCRIGWDKVADSNIDIEGSDGYKHGIDALFKYIDGFHPQQYEGVFLEAKRYKTSSFNAAKIRDWVPRFDEKIRELRISEKFCRQYPEMEKTNPRNGILAIWFHDTDNYTKFSPKFKETLCSVQTPSRRGGPSLLNRLFIIENEGILRLTSLIQSINDWNSSKQTSDQIDAKIKFLYPSSVSLGAPIQELPVLNFEYMYSKFILSRSQELDGNSIKTADIVFYFGALNMYSFYRLKQALLLFNILNSVNNFYLYTYQRDDEFRKIRPDVEKLFKKNGPSRICIKSMDRHADLPSWMSDDTGE